MVTLSEHYNYLESSALFSFVLNPDALSYGYACYSVLHHDRQVVIFIGCIAVKGKCYSQRVKVDQPLYLTKHMQSPQRLKRIKSL